MVATLPPPSLDTGNRIPDTGKTEIDRAPFAGPPRFVATTAPIRAAGPGLEAMQNKRFRIGPMLQAALDGLDAPDAAALRWFCDYCRQRDLPLEECGALLSKMGGGTYSGASVRALLTGKRQSDGAGIGAMIEAIAAFRRRQVVPALLGEQGVIATRLGREVAGRCDHARKAGKFMFIFGRSHIGKSTALKHYAEHRPADCYGDTVFIEAPVGGSATALFDVLRAKFAIGQVHRAGELRDLIAESFAPGMLLIIDQGHRFLRSKRGRLSLDFLIQLHDGKRFGIVLTMTEEELPFFGLGDGATPVRRNMDGLLRQLWNRRVNPLRLPPIPPRDDLDRFAAAVGLPPAPEEKIKLRSHRLNRDGHPEEVEHIEVPRELQDRVCAQESLGVWLTILGNAQQMAKAEGRDISWHAVVKAYCNSLADEGVWGAQPEAAR